MFVMLNFFNFISVNVIVNVIGLSEPLLALFFIVNVPVTVFPLSPVNVMSETVRYGEFGKSVFPPLLLPLLFPLLFPLFVLMTFRFMSEFACKVCILRPLNSVAVIANLPNL